MSSAVLDRPAGLRSELIELGVRAESSITRHERVYAASALAAFGFLAVYHACVRPLWFDEFFTLSISRLSSLREMLRAMPADGQPPLNYLLTHLSLRLLGQSEIGVRLPQLAGYLISGILTYRIVRRHGRASQALFALALTLGSDLCMKQACIARPYGLLLCFTSIAFFCWQAAAIKEKNRAWALTGLSLSIAASILTHHYGAVYMGLFLMAGEVARFLRSRRIDSWMAGAIAAGFLPLAVTFPLARESQRLLFNFTLHATKYGGRARLFDILFYQMMVSVPLVLIVFLFSLILRSSSRDFSRPSRAVPVPAHEWAAATALSLLLPVLMLLAKFETGVVDPRYVIGASLGLALLAGWGLPRLNAGRSRLVPEPALTLSTLCYLLLIALTFAVEMMHRPIWDARPGTEAVSALVTGAPDNLPIVVARALDYPVEWWYSPLPLRRRIVFLGDLAYAVHQPDFLGELSLVEDRAYIPMQPSAYADFLAENPHFLLLLSGNPHIEPWLPARLVHEGWHLKPIATHDTDVLYRVDR